MPSAKPKLIIDTSVFIERAKQRGAISSCDWARALQHINQRYRYCVSYLTYTELLVKLNRGRDSHFTQNREPISYIRLNHQNPVVLEKPPIFAVQKALRINKAPRIDRNGQPVVPVKRQVPDVIRAILQATNKHDLKNGVVVDKSIISFDLDDFEKYEYEPREENSQLLEGLRVGSTLPAKCDQIALALLNDVGLSGAD